MSDPRNTFPGLFDGLRPWSGNPPTSKLSADGCVFYGMNVKDGAGVLWYVVYSIDAGGTPTPRLKLGPNAGQGDLDVDNGWLIVTYFRAVGDGQPSGRIAVPGWVRWPEAQGPAGPAGPQGPKGDPGPATALSTRYTTALDRLCTFLGLT